MGEGRLGEWMGDSLYGIRRPERSQEEQAKSISPDGHCSSPRSSSSPSPSSSFLAFSFCPSGRVARRARSLLLLLVLSLNKPPVPCTAMRSFLSFIFLLATLLASRGTSPWRNVLGMQV